MAKCPNKRKPSDSSSTTETKESGNPKYLTPAQFARLLGPFFRGTSRGAKARCCSERTVREWCKRGLIREAYRTDGGHLRIRMPLSMETRLWLDKRRYDWPFKGKNVVKTGKDFMRVFEPERAEWNALARLYERPINEDIPVPYTWEFGDFGENGLPEPRDPKARIARDIQNEIMRRVRENEPLADVVLIGEVFQWIEKFSRVDRRCPTVTQMAKFLGVSRQQFYRLYPNPRRKIENAYFVVCGRQSKSELPDLNGLDSVQRANRKAKKPDFSTIQKDYDLHSLLRIPRTRRKSFN